MKSPRNLYAVRSKRHHGYDTAHGFVVSATSADRARTLASANCRDEGPEVWLDKAKSTVQNLGVARVSEGVILMADTDG